MVMPKDPIKAEATRKKMSESAIKRCTPEWREERRKSTKHHMEDPNNRKKISNSLKEYFKNPENLKKNVDAILKYYEEHPETKEKLSIIRKKYYEDNPESRLWCVCG
jgi:hypothetical protein